MDPTVKLERSEFFHEHATHPLVSVIIPFYRQEAFLAEAVRSVREQSYPNVEIVVVDDGSPVRASSLLHESDDLLILRTINRGCPAARNYGFRRSAGDYLVFLDSDDRLAPGALKAHVNALQTRSEAVLSFGAVRVIDECGREVRPPHVCRARKNYSLMFFEGNPIGCPGSAMVRRNAFVEAGLFDESFRIVEDYRLYLQLVRRHEFVRHAACVVDYRLHGANGSQNKEEMLKATLAALDKVETENPLTSFERRRIRHGRARWRHAFRPSTTLTYRLRGFYYSFRAMLGVPVSSYFRS